MWAGVFLNLTQHARLTSLGLILPLRCTSRHCFPRRARKTQLEWRRKKSKGRQRRVLPLPREESQRGSRSSKEGKVHASFAVGFRCGDLPPPIHRGSWQLLDVWCPQVPVVPTVQKALWDSQTICFANATEDPWWGSEGAKVFLQPCVRRSSPDSQSSIEVTQSPQLQSGLLFPLGYAASVLPRPPWPHPISHGALKSLHTPLTIVTALSIGRPRTHCLC